MPFLDFNAVKKHHMKNNQFNIFSTNSEVIWIRSSLNNTKKSGYAIYYNIKLITIVVNFKQNNLYTPSIKFIQKNKNLQAQIKIKLYIKYSFIIKLHKRKS